MDRISPRIAELLPKTARFSNGLYNTTVTSLWRAATKWEYVVQLADERTLENFLYVAGSSSQSTAHRTSILCLVSVSLVVPGIVMAVCGHLRALPST